MSTPPEKDAFDLQPPLPPKVEQVPQGGMGSTAVTTAGLSVGTLALLLSPDLLNKLSSREVTIILVVGMVLTSLGGSISAALVTWLRRNK